MSLVHRALASPAQVRKSREAAGPGAGSALPGWMVAAPFTPSSVAFCTMCVLVYGNLWIYFPHFIYFFLFLR